MVTAKAEKFKEIQFSRNQSTHGEGSRWKGWSILKIQEVLSVSSFERGSGGGTKEAAVLM